MVVHKIIIPNNIDPEPSEAERSAARIFAQYYRVDVEFLKPRNGYKQKTPDFIAGGLYWEIKTPTGSSERSIRKHFRRALKQSVNVIIDSRDTKLDQYKIATTLYQLSLEHRKIRKLIHLTSSSDLHELYIHRKKLPKPAKDWYNK